MKYTEIISDKLNELLIKNLDAKKGYKNAAENVGSPKLTRFFLKQSEQREKFAKDLRMEILKYGQIPAETGSFAGAVHRNWMDLKALFASNNEEAILEEAIRGEEESISYYDTILEESHLPESIRFLLIQQKNTILNTIEKLEFEEILVS